MLKFQWTKDNDDVYRSVPQMTEAGAVNAEIRPGWIWKVEVAYSGQEVILEGWGLASTLEGAQRLAERNAQKMLSEFRPYDPAES